MKTKIPVDTDLKNRSLLILLILVHTSKCGLHLNISLIILVRIIQTIIGNHMGADQQSIEQLKHDLAVKLEKEKWGFKKAELEYLEAGQHLRALNQLMWQIPGLAIAITGGLWFGVTSLSDELTKQIILGFIAFIDILTVITLIRLRQIIQLQIDVQTQFSECELIKKWRLPNNTVIFCWSAALIGAAFVSFLAIFSPPSFSKPDEKALKCCECCNKDSAIQNQAKNLDALKKEVAPDVMATPAKKVEPNPVKENSNKVKAHIPRKKTICKT